MVADRYTARLRLREANRCCGTVCRIHRRPVEVPPQRSSSMTETETTSIRRISMNHRSVRPQTTRHSAPALRSRAEDSRAAERQRPSGLGPRARERRLQARLAQQPMPTTPTGNACAKRAFRGTQGVARRNDLSASSSATTPAGPARPFRLARVPRPGMTNTDVLLGTHRPRTHVRSAWYFCFFRTDLNRLAFTFTGRVGRLDSGSKHAACCRRAPIQGEPPGSRFPPVVPPARDALRTAGTIILRMAGNILK